MSFTQIANHTLQALGSAYMNALRTDPYVTLVVTFLVIMLIAIAIPHGKR